MYSKRRRWKSSPSSLWSFIVQCTKSKYAVAPESNNIISIKVTATYPSVYTKISYFIDWIEETIEQNEISNNSDDENSSAGIQIAPRSFIPSGPAGLQPISSKKQ